MFDCLRNPKSISVSNSLQMGVTSSMNARRCMPGPRGLRQAVFDLHNACSERCPHCLSFRLVYINLSFPYCHSGAFSEWSQGGARITGLYDFCVGRTLPQCLLQMETGRCPHCLICCSVTMMLARVETGRARITEFSGFCT